jgi:hypothetical protein
VLKAVTLAEIVRLMSANIREEIHQVLTPSFIEVQSPINDRPRR